VCLPVRVANFAVQLFVPRCINPAPYRRLFQHRHNTWRCTPRATESAADVGVTSRYAAQVSIATHLSTIPLQQAQNQVEAVTWQLPKHPGIISKNKTHCRSASSGSRRAIDLVLKPDGQFPPRRMSTRPIRSVTSGFACKSRKSLVSSALAKGFGDKRP